MKFIFCALLALLSVNAHAIHVVSKQAGIDIKTDKVIHIVGPIQPDVMEQAFKEGFLTKEMKGDRVIVLNSPGGYVELGKMFIAAMRGERRATGGRIICVATQQASSMAFDILSFCDVRLMTAGTESVVHSIEGPLAPGERSTATNLRHLADELDKEELPFKLRNAMLMRMTLAQYQMYCDAETSWTAGQLLKMGYLHGIATIEE